MHLPRVGFVERNHVSCRPWGVPFAEITIPGPVLKAVGLGVMVAFFGLVPNVSDAIG